MLGAVFASALLLAATPTNSPVVARPSPHQVHRRSPYVGAISVDASNGRVLFSDGADRECYPASCTKLMTARLLLKAVREGRVKPNESIVQSRLAASVEPSKIDLAPGETISVSDAMKALMLKSANDIAIDIAERVGGSVEGFVAMMNAEAKAIGMKNTVFASPNGLPPPPGSKRGFDRSTARDLALLGMALVRDQPEIVKFTKLANATVPGRKGVAVPMRNHNNFLWKKNVMMPEVDGLKTGYINAGGSSIVLTGTRNGRRAIVVVTGSDSAKEREANAGRLLSDALGAISW